MMQAQGGTPLYSAYSPPSQVYGTNAIHPCRKAGITGLHTLRCRTSSGAACKRRSSTCHQHKQRSGAVLRPRDNHTSSYANHKPVICKYSPSDHPRNIDSRTVRNYFNIKSFDN